MLQGFFLSHRFSRTNTRMLYLACNEHHLPDSQQCFCRESYVYEVELLEKYSFEETLHMLKVKLINAKRSGRAVKRKLDNALAQEGQPTHASSSRPQTHVPGAEHEATTYAVPFRPDHVAERATERKVPLASSEPTSSVASAARMASNPFMRHSVTAKRAGAVNQDDSSMPATAAMQACDHTTVTAGTRYAASA